MRQEGEGDLEDLVRAFGHGDLVAASTLQPGLRTFRTSFGGIVYARALGTAVTLGGPLCAEDDRKELVRRFLEQERRSTFFYVRADVLPALEHHGLHGAGIGVDREADLQALAGAPSPETRSAVRSAHKAKVTLREVDADAPWPELEAVQRDYLASAQVPVEMAFLNRPMVFGPAPLRRVFVLEERGMVFGFAAINPIYRHRRVTAWLLDILRFRRTRVWGIWLSTVARLGALLAAEGTGLSLGFCPLANVTHPRTLPSPRLRRHVDGMARWLGGVQYLRRLRELKALVPGRDEPRYLASFSSFAAVPLLSFLRASGLGPRVFLGPDLLRVLRGGMRTKHAAEVRV